MAGRMHGAVIGAANSRPQIEKRKSLQERPIKNKIKLYLIGQQSISNDECERTIHHKRSKRSVKVKLKEDITGRKNEVMPKSQLLTDLTESLVNFNGEEYDHETHGDGEETLPNEPQKQTHLRPTCTYLITVFVQICDVIINSHEFVGFVNINGGPKHTEYSYTFTSGEEIIQDRADKNSGAEMKGSIPRMVLKVTFRKCFNYFHSTGPVFSDNVNNILSSRAEKGSQSKTTPKANTSIEINEEVLSHMIRITLNDFSGNQNKPAVKLPTCAEEFLKHCSYICITQHTSDSKEYLSNSSFIESLFSFLTWPLQVSTSAHELAAHGFIRDAEDGLNVKCRSCGLVVNLTDFKGNSFVSSHSESYPECKSSTAYVLSIKGEETERNCYHDDDDNEDDSTHGTDNITPKSLERITSLGTPEIHCTHDSIESLSSERLSNGEDTDANNRQIHSLEQAEGIDEADENIQSAYSDVTSETDLLEIATGGIDRLTYSPRNPRYVSSESRQLSFSTWTRPRDTIRHLVDSGFFFTGEDDVVRCFHCDIGLAEWDLNDDPWVEHARHSPDCPYLRSRKDDQFINNIQLQWAKIYTPKHPHMGSISKRKETFEPSWPRAFVLQTPDQLAEAGFFYTGETDTVRCHYCDGGLREWEPEDDPWTEHARWFPFCKFVVKIKGLQFIQDSAAPEDVPDGDNNDPPPAVAQRMVIAPTFEDKCRKRELKNPMFSAAAESALSFGYSKGTVKDAVMIYIERTGNRDFSAAELLEIIFELEEQGLACFSEDTDIISEEEEFQLTPKAMKMENVYLKKKMLCVGCKEREQCMLFIPCGHRLTCETCSKEHKTCPKCFSEVTSAVKTFLG